MNYETNQTPAAGTNRRHFVKAVASGAAAMLGLAISAKVNAFTPRERFSVSPRTSGTGSENLAGQQVPYVYWTWGEIRRGDCTISPGSVFYLYANGVSRWVCDLRSSDSGDEWDGRFEIKNANGQVLAATPNYHFDISQDNVTKHWDESRGANPSLAAAYPNASSVIFNCSC